MNDEQHPNDEQHLDDGPHLNDEQQPGPEAKGPEAKGPETKGQQTKSLTSRETAWFRLISAAGSLLDGFESGEVTEKNRAAVWGLREAVERVIEVEGMRERPATGDYEVIVERRGDGG
jgi:hypothetical protein